MLPQVKARVIFKNESWIRGKYEDVQSLDLVQLLPIDVVGNWYLRNKSCTMLLGKNKRAVQIVFNECLLV